MNTLCDHRCRAAFTVTTLALAIMGGCDRKGEQAEPKGAKPPARAVPASKVGPDTSAVPIDMSKGWCAGHGVPESVCTRCNSSLVAKFKEGQDWCAGHGLPESQCTNCNPAARELWAALNPANAGTPTIVDDASAREDAKPALGPATSPVEPTLDEGWCGGHGVPESVCTRCAASPAKFKEAGDWCEEHDLPESQCVVCHPEVEAEWAKLNPANQKDNQSGDASDTGIAKALETLPRRGSNARGSIWLEPNQRLLTGSNDSQCQVDRLQVRFLDGSTARKAGIETEIVRTRRLSNTIECLAEVGFDRTRLVRITPRVGGVVTEASVEIGSFVEADDLLAVLESPTLGQAKSRYIRVREGHLLAAAAATVS